MRSRFHTGKLQAATALEFQSMQSKMYRRLARYRPRCRSTTGSSQTSPTALAHGDEWGGWLKWSDFFYTLEKSCHAGKHEKLGSLPARPVTCTRIPGPETCLQSRHGRQPVQRVRNPASAALRSKILDLAERVASAQGWAPERTFQSWAYAQDFRHCLPIPFEPGAQSSHC